MEKVKLYQLKKGDHFKYANWQTGEPEENVYIKGRPHTDTYDNKKMYVTFIYAPGKPYDNNFTGYVDCDREVYKVD